MPVEADLGVRLQRGAHSTNSGGNVVGKHEARAIGAIDRLRAIVLHEQSLFDQGLDRGHVGHHQEADCVHSELAAKADMLFGHIRLGAMGRDVDAASAAVGGHAQLVERADAGHVQHRNNRILHPRCDCCDVFLVAVQASPVVERGAAETITMRHLQQRDARLVQAGGNVDHLFQRDLVTHRMHPVAQAHVVELDLAAANLGFIGHQAASVSGMATGTNDPSRILRANISAVCAAAAVMMSRFPA